MTGDMREETFNASVPPRPMYSSDQLESLDCAALTEFLAADDDRVPRAVIDVCARRGEPMIDRLDALLGEER